MAQQQSASAQKETEKQDEKLAVADASSKKRSPSTADRILSTPLHLNKCRLYIYKYILFLNSYLSIFVHGYVFLSYTDTIYIVFVL